jgi:hydroxymethylpyrimidine/phosphomethylpyrimidine kinase
MTCASSDSGGGAGIQADLKTFAALGVFGFCAISAVTAQNSHEVTDIHPVEAASFRAQLEAVADDFAIDAIKVGLIGSRAHAMDLSEFLERRAGRIPVIVDPVMVSAAGHAFLDAGDLDALKRVLRHAMLATPNVPEAESLSGMEIRSPQDAARAGARILALGPRNVLVKGGHLEGPLAEDVLVGEDAGDGLTLSLPRQDTRNTHGTGCTLSSAIAAFLARGMTLPDAAGEAKRYVWEAMRPEVAPDLGGRGSGPLNHLCRYYGFAKRSGRP